MLYKLSGTTDSTPDLGKNISVNSSLAESSFLKLVQFNVFGLKDLLLSDSSILNGQVKSWYEAQGYDFNQLLIILNQNG